VKGTAAKANTPKPPTVRQVLGRIEARCLNLERDAHRITALESTFRDLEASIKSLRKSTEDRLETITHQDKAASKRIDEQLATLRNQVEALRYKLDTAGVERELESIRANRHQLVLQAANEALKLMIQELERLGVKP
jgi:predicted  nucleic acid-binding Zn-ribbon protein